MHISLHINMDINTRLDLGMDENDIFIYIYRCMTLETYTMLHTLALTRTYTDICLHVHVYMCECRHIYALLYPHECSM